MKYKKFQCVKCGYTWFGYANKPRCRKCNSTMINIAPAIIDEEYLQELQRKAGEKELINKWKNDKKDFTEIKEDIFYDSSSLETEEEEKVVYRCSCGAEIEKGALYCYRCGSALDWENIM